MYNPQQAKEEAALEPDKVYEGAIIDIQDGLVKDFIKNVQNWQGDTESPAINVKMEVADRNNNYQFDQVFTYRNDNGNTVYSPRSNLGKFKRKYGELPRVGCKIKAMSNTDGFLRLKID